MSQDLIAQLEFINELEKLKKFITKLGCHVMVIVMKIVLNIVGKLPCLLTF